MQGHKSYQFGYSSFEAGVSTFSPARWTVLVLFLLCKGLLSQTSEHTITVPETTKVPKGFCAHVPCKFTTPKSYQSSNKPFHGYWFQITRKLYYLIWINMWTHGYLKATNDVRQKARESHFKLTGDPARGDCSFSIVNAGSEDTGWYYFRIDKGEGFRYEFRSKQKGGHTNPQIMLTDLQKPNIQRPAKIIWGEPATFTCEVPGCCYDTNVDILWPVESKSLSKNQWSKEESPWVWTYGVNATFIPTLEDERRVFTCLAQYPTWNKTVQNTIQLLMAYKPELSKTFQSAACWPNHLSLICTCSFHSWPPPRIHWKVDGKDVTENNSSGSLKVTSSAKWNEVSSTLNWTRSPGQNHKHTITCTGTNPFGTHTVNVPEVNVKTGRNFKIVQISGVAAGSLFALAGIGILTYYFIEFRKKEPTLVQPSDTSTEPTSVDGLS